jgi:putative ATP-dependent endonuclease of OLD family
VGSPCNRVNNLNSVKNAQENILVSAAYQTFEYDLSLNNIENTKSGCRNNFLFKYLEATQIESIKHVNTFIDSLADENLSDEQQEKIALLLWKCMPSKADFAQDFAIHITEHLTVAQASFKVPAYIKKALVHLKLSYVV